MAITPNGAYVYVTNKGSDTVSRISTATNTITATVTVGRRPVRGGGHPQRRRTSIVTKVGRTVSVITTATNTVTATVTVGTRP